ncbi:MAG: hypothetical protein HLUCCA08_05810 [Rhodobacteraceae bacterium HLUCCA08]|nr:MAG: hypothetical protein HLUCCA08_05810 [Rhodobacteraceae bacterium HLUCCA08]
MAEDTPNFAAETDIAAEKTALNPEQALRKRAGRTIGRGVWLTGYKAEHPDATREETKLAWAEARKDFTRIGMRALKTLENAGMTVVEAAPDDKS